MIDARRRWGRARASPCAAPRPDRRRGRSATGPARARSRSISSAGLAAPGASARLRAAARPAAWRSRPSEAITASRCCAVQPIAQRPGLRRRRRRPARSARRGAPARPGGRAATAPADAAGPGRPRCGPPGRVGCRPAWSRSSQDTGSVSPPGRPGGLGRARQQASARRSSTSAAEQTATADRRRCAARAPCAGRPARESAVRAVARSGTVAAAGSPPGTSAPGQRRGRRGRPLRDAVDHHPRHQIDGGVQIAIVVHHQPAARVARCQLAVAVAEAVLHAHPAQALARGGALVER